MKLPKLTRKRLIYLLLAILIGMPLCIGLSILISNVLVARQSLHVFTEPDAVEHQKVGLVLGTSRRVYGRPNLYFTYRIDAAEALYKSGKVDVFLVSGDNSTEDYNEPQDMQDALIERGIPEEKIFHDYAGFSTLDSVLRAKRVFGLNSFIVISQGFHCERAIFIARAHSIPATGFASRDVQGVATTRIQIREYLARVKAVLDVYVLRRGPKFLGDDPYHLGE